MCEKINNLNTPINKRCKTLGLRRSIQKSPHIRTPLSDLKVNHKFLNPEVSSPSTPLCAQNIPTTSKSTGYRLNRNFRSYKSTEKCKKKKLDFKEVNIEASDDSCSSSVSSVETKTLTKEELKTEIELKETLLKDMKNHIEKVQQLKSSIETWKTAFNRALDELSSMSETPTEKEEILEMLNIPAEMINLV